MSRFFRLVITIVLGGLFAPALALAAGPSPICFISVTPSSIPPGGSVTLKWESTNATGGAITNVGNVGPSGQKNLLPSNAQYTTYYGSFTGPGGTANCSATVSVYVDPNSAGFNVDQNGGVNSGSAPGSSNTTVNNSDTGIFGSAPSNVPTQSTADAGGSLVTCGLGRSIGTNPSDATGCQACNLAQLVQRMINFLIGLSIPLAALLFAWAGVLYFTSAANPGNKDQAKKIFSSALIGFLIVITAWLIINTLLNVLLNKNQFLSGSWFKIDCSTSGRQVTGDVNAIFSGLPPVSIVPSSPIITTGGGPQCGSDYTYSTNAGSCVFNDRGAGGATSYALPNSYSCPSGSTFSSNSGNCVDEFNPEVTSRPVSNSGSYAGSSQIVQTNNGAFTCGNCALLPSDIPGATRAQSCSTQIGGVCQIDASLIPQIQGLNGSLSSAGVQWYVSEAWPPTVRHQSEAQNGGTSFDISACNSNNGVTSSSGVASCIGNVSQAASQNNFRVVYEVPNDAQRQQIISASNGSVSASQIQVVSGVSPHFSVYKK